MNKLEILKEEIKEVLLGNSAVLWQTVGEINAWNNGLDWLDYQENDEEFFYTYFNGRPMEAVRAASYGEYNYNDEYVKFNGYGNLESASENDVTEEMKDSIDDIIDQIMDNYTNIDLDSDIMDLIEEYEEEAIEEAIEDIIEDIIEEYEESEEN